MMTPKQLAESIVANHVGARTAQTWSELEASIARCITEAVRESLRKCENIAVDYEKMTGEEFCSAYGCDDVSIAIQMAREASECS